ncbi:glycosyltransferase family 2 protein [Oceanobacillus oncorhynchi]|uniref:glycosyltransferase family 2 protein n=1 Tax=Oceanobacillus oncorhynchi TaxID=545501 RepID=UPI0025A3B277|nr:glycosyltransferase [Oceanobacillus oncorhynchi]MDM8101198.1 glycosyltransferase [Oceanobacillus oncorhynchi]
MDKVSVIVPVYNAEDYLPKSIESLMNQTHENIEIILVDDGSKDHSLSICESYANQDSRIKVHNIKNSGVSAARNLGIDVATGEYITFVDSDDWAETNMLEHAVANIKQTGSDLVIWSYLKNYYNKEVKLSLIPGGDQIFEDDKSLLYLKTIYGRYSEQEVTEGVSVGTTWCKLYKTDFIRKNNLKFNPVLTRAQDTIFSIHAFSYAKKISFFDESLYHYRISNSSTTSGTRFITDTHSPFNTLLNEYSSFIQGKDNFEKLQVAFNARTIQVLLWHLEHYYFHERYSKGIWNRRKEIKNLIIAEPYKTALSDVDVRLLPKKEKVMSKLLKRKRVLTFYYIVLLHSKLEKIRKRRFD